MLRKPLYESNHKDIVIAQLKADLFEAQIQQREEQRLLDDLQKWEVKIQLTIDEKQILENEIQARHDDAQKEMFDLQQEIKQITNLIQQQKFEDENHARHNKELREQNELKQNEILQLRKEIQRLSDSIILDTQHLEKLQLRMEQFEIEADQAQLYNQDLLARIEEIQSQNSMLTQYIQKKSAITYQNYDADIDAQQKELKKLNEQILSLTGKVSSNQNGQTQAQLFQLNKDQQQQSLELQRAKKQAVVEGQKKQDLSGRLLQFRGALEQRENENAEVQSELQRVVEDNQEIADQIVKMKDDWKSLQQHIEILLQVNTELVQELENQSLDDVKIRNILNRSSRVKELQQRVAAGNRLKIKKPF